MAVVEPGELAFFLSVLIEGILTGPVYALIALAFVLVYKSSRMINFAVGEWLTAGALTAGVGSYALQLGSVGGLLFAVLAMTAFGLAFNAAVVRRLSTGPAISVIMVTLGLGAVMRGLFSLMFSGIPAGLPLPIPSEPLHVRGVIVPLEKLAAAVAALAAMVVVTWLYTGTRTGIALRAIADDRQAALALGINVDRHFGLIWALAGILSVGAGVLWVLVAGGGFGIALVGLKVFPIVFIGGLDSVPGTIVAALLIGMIESLAAAYLDPQLGAGFGAMASYMLLLAILFVRPYGLFGRPPAERI